MLSSRKFQLISLLMIMISPKALSSMVEEDEEPSLNDRIFNVLHKNKLVNPAQLEMKLILAYLMSQIADFRKQQASEDQKESVDEKNEKWIRR